MSKISGQQTDEFLDIGNFIAARDRRICEPPFQAKTSRINGALRFNAMTSMIVRPGAWSARCSCSGGNFGFLEQNFVGAAHRDHRLFHAVLHPLHERRHANEARHAENDAEHREQRTDLCAQISLNPN